MLSVFLTWEHRHGDAAMIPINMLRQRVVYCSCLASGFQFAAIQLFSYYMPIWFQTVKGASPSMSGVYFLPTFGGLMVASLFCGVLGKLLP